MTEPYSPENGQQEQPLYAEPAQPQYGAQYDAQYGAQYTNAQTAQYDAQYGNQQQYIQPQYQYAQPQYQQAQPVGEAPNPVMVLVFGIISLALSLTFYLSIVGFIFGILGKNKAQDYINSGAAPATQVTVGKRLATAGFIVGLIMSIFFTIFLFAWLLV